MKRIVIFTICIISNQIISQTKLKKTDNKIDSIQKLDEVIITTSLKRNTESSILYLQRNSVKLMDGLSLESIKNSGASDIASAVKNIPGVSVQRGKYVYVRGLGDRYTKTSLNGVDVQV